MKNRNRDNFSFANINLLGKCNADCFFCLGKDLEKEFSKQDQINIHFLKWKNFNNFIRMCNNLKIKKIYLTGQNTDSLLYKYFGELRDYLQTMGFLFGVRTNGYKAESMIDELNRCNNTIGLTINCLDQDINFVIMAREDIPDWNTIIPSLKNVRVSIVINRYNADYFLEFVKFISKFKNVKYIQARRISTDTRFDLLKEDIEIYEKLYNHIKDNYKQIGEFHLAQQFEIYGKEVDFWRTTETSVNSINYFTDGTLSNEYFIIEGYLKHHKNI